MLILLPEKIKKSIQKNIGSIVFIKQIKKNNLYTVIARDFNDQYDIVYISKKPNDAGWKINVKKGYPSMLHAYQGIKKT